MRVTSIVCSVAGRALLAVVLSALALGLPSAAAASVSVAFLQGEQTISVERPGSTAQDAMTELLAGPTAAEYADGIRTYVPKTVALRSVSVADGIATVDLSLPFAGDDDPDSLRARLTQVVRTLTGPEGAKGVRLLVEGGTPLGLFPGITTTATLTVAYLDKPDVKAPSAAATKPPTTTTSKTSATRVSSTRLAQQRLAALGYLLPGDVDGQAGPVTEAAVIAFQKWTRISRDGVLGPLTRSRLARSRRPTPETRAAGRRVEVLLDRQLALAIQDNRVVRALHVSTGAPATPTPIGTYKVYAQFQKWWSTPFREWLLWASPFNGGIAFHELSDVPVVAASHGCVRLTAAQARWLYGFVKVGTPVKVIARS